MANLPALPPGWTEHIGPGGQPYYYHAASQQSTYVRPFPALAAFPPRPPPGQVKKKKKEKPLVKTPIPGTDWLRVKTTEDNIFYTHKGLKESFWVVPDEIRAAVEALKSIESQTAEESQVQQQDHMQSSEAERVRQEQAIEVERIKTEVQGALKRRAEEPTSLQDVVKTKKLRSEEQQNRESADEYTGDEEHESEEEWQREAAAELLAEAEAEKLLKEEARPEQEKEEAEAMKIGNNRQLNIPDRVDLSLEEAKALFKTLLRERDINPLHPWDTSLPLFVSDPRYVLLPSVSARREAFDEYCRDRSRELRQQNVRKDRVEANPKEDFERLLSEEVKSTRSSWSDFRRNWKKDRRFYGWGRDDREREKRFREFLKELGEKKRAAAKKAEADFFSLLRESGLIRSNTLWKDIKRHLSHDLRYEGVGSASLREELFNTFLKAQTESVTSKADNNPDRDQSFRVVEQDSQRGRQEKQERALREREEKVRAELGRVEAEIGRSRFDLNKGEGEREFWNLLTDAIRDPQLTWDDALSELKKDPRFAWSPLSKDQRLHIFHSYMDQLRAKHLGNLHSLFEAHAPLLATAFCDLPVESLLRSSPATKLALGDQGLEREFEKWQRERGHNARKAFDAMLAENAFVEFWGRLGKLGGEGVAGGVEAENLGEDEGEGFGGKVDMKAMAKNVDLDDIVKVLKNDRRYIVFDHISEQREKWIRNYLAELPPPKLSYHI